MEGQRGGDSPVMSLTSGPGLLAETVLHLREVNEVSLGRGNIAGYSYFTCRFVFCLLVCLHGAPTPLSLTYIANGVSNINQHMLIFLHRPSHENTVSMVNMQRNHEVAGESMFLFNLLQV